MVVSSAIFPDIQIYQIHQSSLAGYGPDATLWLQLVAHGHMHGLLQTQSLIHTCICCFAGCVPVFIGPPFAAMPLAGVVDYAAASLVMNITAGVQTWLGDRPMNVRSLLMKRRRKKLSTWLGRPPHYVRALNIEDVEHRPGWAITA